MAAPLRPLRSPGCWPAYAALLVACQTASAPTPPESPTDSGSDTTYEVPDTRPGTPCEETGWEGTYVWDDSLNEDACLSAADPETWCTYVPDELGGGTSDCPTLEQVLTASGFLAGDPISYANEAWGCPRDGQNFTVFYHVRQYVESAGQHWLIFDDAGFMVAYATENRVYTLDFCCEGRETHRRAYGDVVWPRCEDPVSYGPEDFR